MRPSLSTRGWPIFWRKALDVTTGREKWKVAFGRKRAACTSRPIVRDETIYLTARTGMIPGDASQLGDDYLYAIDRASGRER